MLSKYKFSFFILTFIPVVSTLHSNAQNVGINETGANPHTSAMLDVVADDKGILVPRVDIVDLATPAPITGPTTSLLVYNTNVTSGIGYYFWDNTKWTKILDANSNADHDWYEVGGTNAPDAITDNVFTQGKVGIGNTNPDMRLAVQETGAFDYIARFHSTGATANPYQGIRLGTTEGGSLYSDLVVSRSMDVFGISVGMSAGDLVMSTQSDMDMDFVITRAGDIGIGLVDPDTKLHVYNQTGDTKITIEADPTNTNEQDNPSIELIQDGALIKASVSLIHDAGIGFLGTPVINRTSSNAFLFNTYAPTSSASTTNGKIDFATLDTVRMSINGLGGNVGIGTSTPTETLEVLGTVKFVDGTQGAGKVLVSDANGKASWKASAISTNIFSTSNSYPFSTATPASGAYYNSQTFTITVAGIYKFRYDFSAPTGYILCIDNVSTWSVLRTAGGRNYGDDAIFLAAGNHTVKIYNDGGTAGTFGPYFNFSLKGPIN